MSEEQRAQPTALEIRERRQRVVSAAVDRAMGVAATHITRDRFSSVVLGAFAKTPKLEECSPASLALCLMTCAQYGLEPNGPMGHAYLIPRATRKEVDGVWRDVLECTLMLGYRGMAELARRSGEIRSIDARVVYVGEDVDISAGSDGLVIRHKISTSVNRSGVTPDNAVERIVGAYAVATTKDGGRYGEFLPIDQIEERRKRGASGSTISRGRNAGKRVSTPWDTDYAAMARKSALRALLGGGLVPMSAEILQVVEQDDPPAIEAADLRQRAPTPVTIPGLAPAQIEVSPLEAESFDMSTADAVHVEGEE